MIENLSANWSTISQFVLNEFFGALLAVCIAAFAVLFFRVKNVIRRMGVRRSMALADSNHFHILITDFSASTWMPRPRLYFDNRQRRTAALLKVSESIKHILPNVPVAVHDYPITIGWSGFDTHKRQVSSKMLCQAEKVMSKTGANVLVSARLTPDFLLDVVFYSKRGGATEAKTMGFQDTSDMSALWQSELAVGVSLYSQSATNDESLNARSWSTSERLNYLRTFSGVLTAGAISPALSVFEDHIHHGYDKIAREALECDWFSNDSLLWSVVQYYKANAFDESGQFIVSKDALFPLWTALFEVTAFNSDTLSLELALERVDLKHLGLIFMGLVDRNLIPSRSALLFSLETKVRLGAPVTLAAPAEEKGNEELQELYASVDRARSLVERESDKENLLVVVDRVFQTALSLYDERPLLAAHCLHRLSEIIDQIGIVSREYSADWSQTVRDQISELIACTKSSKILASLYFAQAKLHAGDYESKSRCYQIVHSLAPHNSYPHVRDNATYRLSSVNCRRAEANPADHHLFDPALRQLRQLRIEVVEGPYSYPPSMGGNHARALIMYVQLDRARRGSGLIRSRLTTEDEERLLEEAVGMLTDDLCNGVGFQHDSLSTDAWNSCQWVSYLGLVWLIRAQVEQSADRELIFCLKALFYTKAARWILSCHQRNRAKPPLGFQNAINDWRVLIEQIEGSIYAIAGALKVEVPSVSLSPSDENLNAYLAEICSDVDRELLNSLAGQSVSDGR